MNPTEASQLLQLPEGSSPGELEARFRELRALYEGKIASALTPGLRDKYAATLADVTAAYETLVLARDSASLPGMSRPPSPTPAASSPRLPSLPPLPASNPATAPTVPYVPPAPAAPAPAVRKKSPLRFVVPAIVVVVAVAFGVRWWQNTEAETQARLQREALAQKQADDARQAAEAAEKLRLAAAEKAEREKRDQELAALRTRLTEINGSFDSAARALQAAERERDELKTRRDELAAAGKGPASPEARALTAQIDARERYLAWFTPILATHPAKAARQQANEALTARSPAAAAPAIEAYAKLVRQLQLDIGKAREELLVTTGRLRITSEPSGLGFKLTDAYGRDSEATTPADLSDVSLGNVTVTFRRPDWPDYVQTATVTRTETAAAHGKFVGGTLQLASEPSGLDFTFTGHGVAEPGRTPATLGNLTPGEYTAVLTRPGWPDLTHRVTVRAGETISSVARFAAGGTLKVTSTPIGAAVSVGGKNVGKTPLTVTDLAPGPISVALELAEYRPITLEGAVESGKETALTATLRSAQLTPDEAFEKLALEAKGSWVLQYHNPISGNQRLYLRFTPGSRKVTFEQTGFGGSVRTVTMVEYDPATRIVLLAFSGLDAMNGKQGVRLDGDILRWGDPKLKKPWEFHRE